MVSGELIRFQGANSFKIVFIPPFSKGVYSKRKEIASSEANSFRLEYLPFASSFF